MYTHNRFITCCACHFFQDQEVAPPAGRQSPHQGEDEGEADEGPPAGRESPQQGEDEGEAEEAPPAGRQAPQQAAQEVKF